MPTRKLTGSLAPVMSIAAAAWVAEPSSGVSVVVLNDSVITLGSPQFPCTCFLAGEEVAVWLTSPCDGDLVAVRILWRSELPGAPDTIEQRIAIHEPGVFPVPGSILAEIVGPTLVEGVFNDFLWLDAAETIPMEVPVLSDEDFVVSLQFLNTNDGNPFAGTVVADVDGCEADRNAVKAIPGGWFEACTLGVPGDWVIRGIVDCACPADVNGDGIVNVTDLLEVILDWGCTDPPGPCVADTNTDGSVDVLDLVAVILGWGPCPPA